jgi:hypothetical protein
MRDKFIPALILSSALIWLILTVYGLVSLSGPSPAEMEPDSLPELGGGLIWLALSLYAAIGIGLATLLFRRQIGPGLKALGIAPIIVEAVIFVGMRASMRY